MSNSEKDDESLDMANFKDNYYASAFEDACAAYAAAAGALCAAQIAKDLALAAAKADYAQREAELTAAAEAYAAYRNS